MQQQCSFTCTETYACFHLDVGVPTSRQNLQDVFVYTQEEGRAGNSAESSLGLQRRMPRRTVVRSLSTIHMMGFTPLGFFETVSEGENLVEGHMALPTSNHTDSCRFQPQAYCKHICASGK